MRLLADGQLRGKKANGKNAHEVFRPLQRVGVEVLVVCAEAARPPAVRLVYGAEPGEWTPVEGAADVVRSSGRGVRLEDQEEAMIGRLLMLVARPIPARFHDVDLTCR